MRLLHLHDLGLFCFFFFPLSEKQVYLLWPGIREFAENGKVQNSRSGRCSRLTKEEFKPLWGALGFLNGSMSKGILSAGGTGDVGSVCGQEDTLEDGMATHSTILAWKIHGQRRLAGLSLKDHRELDTTEWLNTHAQALGFWLVDPVSSYLTVFKVRNNPKSMFLLLIIHHDYVIWRFTYTFF